MKQYNSNTDFSFVMDVAKSFTQVEADGPRMIIKGVASNTRRDLVGDAFTRQGLESIKQAIEEGIIDSDGDRVHVPLRSGHGEEWEHVLGDIIKAEIDDEENLWITAELDEDSSKAHDLYRKLTKGNAKGKKVKLGLSVRGKVTKYHFVWDPELGKQVPRFDNMLIKEVSVTQKPANPTPYPLAISKSLLNDPGYAQALEESMDDQTPKDMVIHPAQAADTTELKNVEGEAAAEQNEIAADQANIGLQESTPEADAVAEGNIETPQAPSEPQRVSDTPAEDSDSNDVPAGYAAVTTPESEPQEAAPQDVAVVTEPVVAEPSDSLKTQIDALIAQIEALRGQVESLKAQPPVEAQKALEEVTEPAIPEPVAEEVSLDERIALAVTKAFETMGLATVAKEVEAVKSLVDEMSQQPNDKSISVIKAKDEQDMNDPMAKFKTLRESGKDSISAAFGAAVRR